MAKAFLVGALSALALASLAQPECRVRQRYRPSVIALKHYLTR
jgi:hypothetical protein